jgi:serine protease inhibitor
VSDACSAVRGRGCADTAILGKVLMPAGDDVAEFTAEGFEAAAVTAMAAVGAGMRAVPPGRVKEVRVELDRPFGFFASHRASGLILAAGWVAEPEPYRATVEEFGLPAGL